MDETLREGPGGADRCANGQEESHEVGLDYASWALTAVIVL